jgi:hypothetical protein
MPVGFEQHRRNRSRTPQPVGVQNRCRKHEGSSVTRVRIAGQVLRDAQLTANCKVAMCVVLVMGETPNCNRIISRRSTSWRWGWCVATAAIAGLQHQEQNNSREQKSSPEVERMSAFLAFQSIYKQEWPRAGSYQQAPRDLPLTFRLLEGNTCR